MKIFCEKSRVVSRLIRNGPQSHSLHDTLATRILIHFTQLAAAALCNCCVFVCYMHCISALCRAVCWSVNTQHRLSAIYPPTVDGRRRDNIPTTLLLLVFVRFYADAALQFDAVAGRERTTLCGRRRLSVLLVVRPHRPRALQ